MGNQIFVRLTGALGAATLGAFFVGLFPFIGTGPTAAGYTVTPPAFTVNREFKGDRLPLPANFNFSQNGQPTMKARAVTPEEIPVGCDASFSPISAPHFAYVYGRCAT